MLNITGVTLFERPILKVSVTLLFIALFLFSSQVYAAYPHKFSDSFSISLSKDFNRIVKVGVADEAVEFFHKAEKFIETENLDGLMELYSENYMNARHNKSDIRKIWEKIFAKFDKMATSHNMRIVTNDTDSKMMIIRCTGMLLGAPLGEEDIVSIDNWSAIDHILVKEEGEWKIIGTTGKEQKRFWFDRAMHPLF